MRPNSDSKFRYISIESNSVLLGRAEERSNDGDAEDEPTGSEAVKRATVGQIMNNITREDNCQKEENSHDDKNEGNRNSVHKYNETHNK